jgi:acetyl-CoA carboxylase biotin carboxylase subunit
MAQSEALASFGDKDVYIEKLIEGPHHIEVQVFGDHHGNLVHLFERECSIQRRHQKVIEETPSPFISQKTREKICEMAVRLAKAVGYYNAGTVECLVDQDQNFYFLEMNTRLQVEHPITELVTGTDLVKTQILVAQGEKLPFQQKDLTQTGHAIECRVYAEDPFHHFRPSPGLIIDQQNPLGPGIRLDSGVYQGFEVPMEYDPILSKLIAYGSTRQEALQRMARALKEYRISGPKTNLYFHRRAIEVDDFQKGKYDTNFVDKHLEEILQVPREDKIKALMAAALGRYLQDKKRIVKTEPGAKAEASAWRLLGRQRTLS